MPRQSATRTLLLALLAISVTPSAHALNCKKGIPCGGACIPAGRTCHVGEVKAYVAPAAPRATSTVSTPAASVPHVSSAAGASVAATSAATVPAAAVNKPMAVEWLGSVSSKSYFKVSCGAAWTIPVSDMRPFESEQEAQRSGYSRSREPGC